jgi:hypothetical protein
VNTKSPRISTSFEGENIGEVNKALVYFLARLKTLHQSLFTLSVFSPPKDVGICGDLVFTQYSQIPSNILPQKYSTMMESF